MTLTLQINVSSVIYSSFPNASWNFAFVFFFHFFAQEVVRFQIYWLLGMNSWIKRSHCLQFHMEKDSEPQVCWEYHPTWERGVINGKSSECLSAWPSSTFFPHLLFHWHEQPHFVGQESVLVGGSREIVVLLSSCFSHREHAPGYYD